MNTYHTDDGQRQPAKHCSDGPRGASLLPILTSLHSLGAQSPHARTQTRALASEELAAAEAKGHPPPTVRGSADGRPQRAPTHESRQRDTHLAPFARPPPAPAKGAGGRSSAHGRPSRLCGSARSATQPPPHATDHTSLDGGGGERGGGWLPKAATSAAPLPGLRPLAVAHKSGASMAFVTDSNRPQPLRQPPPTACLPASGAASEVPSLVMHPWGRGRACPRGWWWGGGGVLVTDGPLHTATPRSLPHPRDGGFGGAAMCIAFVHDSPRPMAVGGASMTIGGSVTAV